MRPLMSDVDVVIANEEDLQSVLGIHVKGADVTSGTLDVDAYREAAAAVTETLGPSLVAITLRESLSASDNGWSAVLWDGASKTLHQSQHYNVRLVDRIGGGDSFAAGLIYGLVTGRAARRGAALRRRRERAEADDSWGLQSGQRRRSGCPGRRATRRAEFSASQCQCLNAEANRISDRHSVISAFRQNYLTDEDVGHQRERLAAAEDLQRRGQRLDDLRVAEPEQRRQRRRRGRSCPAGR